MLYDFFFLSRLFTELAESFLEKILSTATPKNSQYVNKILDLVLTCVGHHDYEVAEITFNLWYVLSEELYQRNNKELMEQFRPYIERLITALCRHCRMEPDSEGLLEDGDEFKDFRFVYHNLLMGIKLFNCRNRLNKKINNSINFILT